MMGVGVRNEAIAKLDEIETKRENLVSEMLRLERGPARDALLKQVLGLSEESRVIRSRFESWSPIVECHVDIRGDVHVVVDTSAAFSYGSKDFDADQLERIKARIGEVFDHMIAAVVRGRSDRGDGLRGRKVVLRIDERPEDFAALCPATEEN